jgi:hypothetical protein
MDELNEDDIRKAMKEYEGISMSQHQRQKASLPDFSHLAGQFFVMHLSQDTQITRSVADFCHSVAHEIYIKWINEDVHTEFFEGEMTRTEIEENVPEIYLDRRKFFEAMILGIEMWLDSMDSQDEHERKRYDI